MINIGTPSHRSNRVKLNTYFNFNVHGSMYRNNILIYIQQDATLHIYFIRKLLYMFRVVPPPIIRSTNNCTYSIWYLSHRYCYLQGVRHPQHTQTSSNSSTIAAGSSNGVTNTRCCRYSCLHS